MTNARVIEADGYRWSVSSDDDHLALGGHETALEPILVSMSNPSKLHLNVGAHVGGWAVRLAKYFEYTYAFEANDRTAYKLGQNILVNGLDSQVAVFNSVIWDTDDDFVTLIDANGMDTGGSTRAESLSEDSLVQSKVRGKQTTTLDSLYYSIPVGLITIDVEGAEARVLRGAKELIARDRPNIEIELHEGHPGTDTNLRQQVYALLDDYGYSYSSVEITGERLLCYPNENVLDDSDLPETVVSGSIEPDLELEQFLRGNYGILT